MLSASCWGECLFWEHWEPKRAFPKARFRQDQPDQLPDCVSAATGTPGRLRFPEGPKPLTLQGIFLELSIEI